MASPFKMSFVSDVSGFLKGTRDIEGALEDVSGSLDDVSREAGQSGERAGSEFSDGIESGMRDVESDAQRAGSDAGDAFTDGLTQGEPGRELRGSVEGDVEALRQSIGSEADQAAADVESATERMETSFKGTFDEVPRNASSNLTQMSQSVDEGSSRARASMNEVKQEATQNAAETFSSFDGSAKSLVDGVQGTFGGIVSALGPLGAAIGAVGAVGIGAITSNMEKAKEEAQDLRDRIGDLTGRLNELRTGGTTAVEQVADQLVEMSEATEEGETSLSGLNDALEMIGLQGDSLERVSQALAGDPEQLDEVTQKVRERVEAMREQNVEGFEEGLVHDLRIANGEELLSQLETEQEAQQAARDNEQLLIDAGIEDLEREAEAREAKKDAAVEYLDEEAAAAQEFRESFSSSITEAYQEAGGAFDQFIEDGKANLEEYVQHMEDQAAAVRDYQVNMVEASEHLSSQALEYVQSLGPAAAPMLEEFVNLPASDPMKQRTAAAWHEQAVVGSDAYQSGIEQNMPSSVPGPHVDVSVPESWEIQDAMNRELARVRVRPVQVRWDIDQAV